MSPELMRQERTRIQACEDILRELDSKGPSNLAPAELTDGIKLNAVELLHAVEDLLAPILRDHVTLEGAEELQVLLKAARESVEYACDDCAEQQRDPGYDYRARYAAE